jgi:hypothetical protein
VPDGHRTRFGADIAQATTAAPISHLDWLRFVVWLVLGLALYCGFGYRNSKLNGTQG